MSAMSLRLKNLQILAALAREYLWLEVIVKREGGSSCHLSAVGGGGSFRALWVTVRATTFTCSKSGTHKMRS